MRNESIWSLHVAIQFSASLLKVVSFFQCVLLTSSSNSSIHRCIDLHLGLQFHMFFYFYYCSSVVQFQISDSNTSSSLFIIQDSFLSYSGVCVRACVYVYKADNWPFKFCEELCWNVGGEFTELWLPFGRMAFFPCINCTDPWLWRSFHLLISFSVSFFNALKFLSCMSFICLIRVTPKIFYIIWGCCEKYCFPGFFLSPFLYRKASDLNVNFVSCYFFRKCLSVVGVS